ncbi:MAG: hypothetical protein JKY67_10640 [Pseudomonadales bacterium]|nr:hypothetical protein [Pseudomonadales bacterium]
MAATKKSGVNNSAIGVFGALKNEISAKSPDPIAEADAVDLSDCIDELIAELQAAP